MTAPSDSASQDATLDAFEAMAVALFGRPAATPIEHARVYEAVVAATVAAGRWPRPINGKGLDADAAIEHAARYVDQVTVRCAEEAVWER